MCRQFYVEDLRCVIWHGSDCKVHQLTSCIVQPTRKPDRLESHVGIAGRLTCGHIYGRTLFEFVDLPCGTRYSRLYSVAWPAVRTERATEAKTTPCTIPGQFRHTRRTILNMSAFLNYLWLLHDIGLGSFRHVDDRRHMAGGTRHTQTFTKHAHAQMLYKLDQDNVSPLRFVMGVSVSVVLRSASSASASGCDAAKVFVHRMKRRGVLHALPRSPDRLAAAAPSSPIRSRCPHQRNVCLIATTVHIR